MEKSYKLSERAEMSDVSFASALLKETWPNGGVGARILKASRDLRWRFGRTRDIWYEQARRIDAREMDQLRAAKRTHEIEEARHDYQALRARISGIKAALAVVDEEFHRADLDGIEQSLRGLGGVVGAGTEGGSK